MIKRIICRLLGHNVPVAPEFVDTVIEVALSKSYQCARCKALVHQR